MATGLRTPSQFVTRQFMGRVAFQNFRGIPVAKAWPRKRGKKGTPAQMQARADFTKMVRAVQNVLPSERAAAVEIADGTPYTWRDVLSRAVTGQLVNLVNIEDFI